MIILEEAALLSSNLIEETVLPMLQIRNSCIVMISTPGSDSHLFSKLMKARRNNGKGEFYFRTHQEQMICSSCERRGVKTCCAHNSHKVPHWISRKNQADLRELMGDELYDQEISGKQQGEQRPDFTPQQINTLRKKDFFVLTQEPKIAFIAIDPTSGGRSKMAICDIVLGTHGSALVCVWFVYMILRYWDMHNSPNMTISVG